MNALNETDQPEGEESREKRERSFLEIRNPRVIAVSSVIIMGIGEGRERRTKNRPSSNNFISQDPGLT